MSINPKKPLVDKKAMASKVIDGALAGMVGVTATFPLDLSKTRLQNQGKAGGPVMYKNLFHVLDVLRKSEGIGAWYKGFGVNFGMISFEKAIKLTFNDFFRAVLTDRQTGVIHVPQQILAGGLAGFFQSSVTTPMELLKIRMQVGEKNVIRNVMASGGFKSFYKGWGATLARDIPFSCFYFPIYAELKKKEPLGGGAWWNFSCGLLSGAGAGWIVTPLDVIKTRVQAGSAGTEKTTWLGTTTKIMSQEGPTAFYKGSIPRMVCIGSLFAVAQAMYELEVGKKVVNKFTQ
jgi:solute carrier family 25 glutamate transporter 18/22